MVCLPPCGEQIWSQIAVEMLISTAGGGSPIPHQESDMHRGHVGAKRPIHGL